MNEKEEFWISKENVEALTNTSFQLMFHTMLPTVLRPIDSLIECFKKDGPYGLDYSIYSDFEDMQAMFTKTVYEQHMISGLIPAFGNGIKEKLEDGGFRVLDVGCGEGFHSCLLAENYSKSQFVGLDICEKAIKSAKLNKKSDGSDFQNLEFVVGDAMIMPEDWTGCFDLVAFFGSLHDLLRPDLVRKIP